MGADRAGVRQPVQGIPAWAMLRSWRACGQRRGFQASQLGAPGGSEGRAHAQSDALQQRPTAWDGRSIRVDPPPRGRPAPRRAGPHRAVGALLPPMASAGLAPSGAISWGAPDGRRRSPRAARPRPVRRADVPAAPDHPAGHRRGGAAHADDEVPAVARGEGLRGHPAVRRARARVGERRGREEGRRLDRRRYRRRHPRQGGHPDQPPRGHGRDPGGGRLRRRDGVRGHGHLGPARARPGGAPGEGPPRRPRPGDPAGPLRASPRARRSSPWDSPSASVRPRPRA